MGELSLPQSWKKTTTSCETEAFSYSVGALQRLFYPLLRKPKSFCTILSYEQHFPPSFKWPINWFKFTLAPKLDRPASGTVGIIDLHVYKNRG
jgi:hypothetical protein